uniref:Replication protein n=1 Tax=Yersinia enterocolitica TaxID=630 RepID=Q70W73_YEREN|nr:replication protein [Yersinia enterocolitica]
MRNLTQPPHTAISAGGCE